MRDFKIFLRSGERVSVQGDRLQVLDNSDVHPEHPDEPAIVIFVDVPEPGTSGAYSCETVGVFPVSQVKAAFAGEILLPMGTKP
jgi:hypothetical protein